MRPKSQNIKGDTSLAPAISMKMSSTFFYVLVLLATLNNCSEGKLKKLYQNSQPVKIASNVFERFARFIVTMKNVACRPNLMQVTLKIVLYAYVD